MFKFMYLYITFHVNIENYFHSYFQLTFPVQPVLNYRIRKSYLKVIVSFCFFFCSSLYTYMLLVLRVYVFIHVCKVAQSCYKVFNFIYNL